MSWSNPIIIKPIVSCLCFKLKAQAGINIARRNINHLSYVDDTTLMAESEEELKSLLMKVERGE